MYICAVFIAHLYKNHVSEFQIVHLFSEIISISGT